MLFNQQEILQALSSELINHNLNTNTEIDQVVIDSHEATKNTLFICIKGENNDGHDYIEQALENGCEAILVHKKELLKKYQNLILVKDTYNSLYEIAKFSRARSSAKFIAITGSMGKTTTKEIIKTIFSSQGKTYATKGNLNNHYGVPLTLSNLEPETRFAIIEMGMNHLNEISPLSKLTKPDISIITGITSAHIENFKDEREIALAKSEIFDGLNENGTAIINHDNEHFEFLEEKASKKTKNIISFGQNKESDYKLENIEIKNIDLSKITIKSSSKTINYDISSSNKAIISNSLMALICLDLIGSDFEDGLTNFTKIKAEPGRTGIINLKIDNKNITIIDDSYNANLASMKAGINYLYDLKKSLNKARSISILGDIFELGEKSQEIHQEILNFSDQLSDLTITTGQETKKAIKILDKNFKNYLNSKELALDIKNIIQNGDILLIKGSRGMAMERIIEELKG